MVLIFASPFIPLYNVCILVAEVSQLDTHLSFSDVEERRRSDKDLRFGREQTIARTQRGAARLESVSF